MKLDDIKKLQQKKYRAEFGHFLVEGEHLVLELQKAAQHNPLLQRSQLYVTEAHEQWQSPFKTQVISERQMAQISDTKTPQGIIAVVPMLESAALVAAGERAIYLHEVQDPGNLGTILRTLAWFGGLRCLLSPGSVDPYNPKVVRGSMGAILRLPVWAENWEVIHRLTTGLDVWLAAARDGVGYTAVDWQRPAALLVGSEAQGAGAQAERLATGRVTIPMHDATESLNAAMAAGLLVFEAARQRGEEKSSRKGAKEEKSAKSKH